MIIVLLCSRNFRIIFFYSLFTNTVRESWTASSVDEKCQFKCRNGQYPKPNPSYVATSNGCGVPGVQMPKLPDYIRDSYELEDCCSRHDICYGTCNAGKNECDQKFRHCLCGICSNLMSPKPGCKSIAEAFYAAVMIMGCKHYLEAQKEACICNEESYRPNYDL